MFNLMPARKELKERMLAPTPFDALRRDFAILFDRMFPEWPAFEAVLSHEFKWEETEKEFILTAEVPGFTPEEIDVTLRGNWLMVTAEKKAKEEKKPEKFVEREKVVRTVSLPEHADLEKIEVKYLSGVLTVLVPKTPKSVPRKLTIKT